MIRGDNTARCSAQDLTTRAVANGFDLIYAPERMRASKVAVGETVISDGTPLHL